jgi:hypothetical protein
MSDLQQAIKRKIAALKVEAARLTGDLVGEEKEISRMQCLQAELAAKLSRSAARRVEIRDGITRLHEEIRKEEEIR